MTPWLFIALGAGVVLLMVLLVVVAVWFIVHAHEARELRWDAARHAETQRAVDDLRRLTMAAINQRDRVEKDVGDLTVRVNDLDSRVKDLEGL